MAKKKKAELVAPPAERTAEERLATHGYIGFTTHISSAGLALAISGNLAGARPEDRRLVDLLDDLCRVDNGAFRARAAGWPEERIADAVRHDLGVHLVKAGFPTDAAPEWPKIDLRRDGWRLSGDSPEKWVLEHAGEEAAEDEFGDEPCNVYDIHATGLREINHQTKEVSEVNLPGPDLRNEQEVEKSRWNTPERLEPVPCRRCERLLTAPMSIKRGFGAACARRERLAELARAEEKKDQIPLPGMGSEVE